ncbi:glycerate kinase [uncultured Microbacterium sp.]|uniref:glycerate kinase n=1 Tax=uncultured Microbacterium sp. TaxID=191216 RepID=UPI0028D3BE45|nr:glycerate kinase [uncultured Microbacterium sp.]
MRVVLAPDSFKGSIGAADAAAELAAGWRSVDPTADLIARPMADGGEGTLAAFAAAVPGSSRMPVTVTGPHGRPVAASWLLLPPTAATPHGTAVIELASTSGIELLGSRLRPLDAHSVGFGEAIAAALDAGVSQLVLGIGSSASTDGGTGMLTALGARFADAEGHAISHGARGPAAVATADLSDLRQPPPGGVLVLSDVSNPLLGARGSAAVFGPQKGMDAAEISAAEAGLRRVAALLPADPELPGSGAAGGVGFGLLAWGARLVPGAAEVAELIDLPEALSAASVVVTGEGSFDGQSAAGKAPTHVAALAAAADVPVVLVAGRIAPDADTSAFAAVVSLSHLAGGEDAARSAPERWLREAGAVLARASRG